ncbi:SIMPL domain-containing protein [Streptomyces sp. NPDC001292]|uniref:SIMPL domain-containing protein n=1 Tax=Streptomyces sp. NPDC001292 TaxID=3364558 RepID=UPI0036C846C4
MTRVDSGGPRRTATPPEGCDLVTGERVKPGIGDRVGRMASASAPEPGPAVPYGTPDAPRIAVRGEAHLEVDPEIARIGITVTARGKDRRSALDDLTRRNARVLDLVKSYGPAVEHLEDGRLLHQPRADPARPRRARPHLPRRRPSHRRTLRFHRPR